METISAGKLETLLRELITELDTQDTVGLALVGSHARGDATAYSDIDLDHYVRAVPDDLDARYAVQFRQGYMVTVSANSMELQYQGLRRPEEAIEAVPGLRDMRILLDRDHALVTLQERARRFRWEPLQANANTYAGHVLVKAAEGVFKILGGLASVNASAVSYTSLTWLLPRLTWCMAVQRGVMIRSRNSFFTRVQEDVGIDSVWTRYHRRLAGLDERRTALTAWEMAGQSALGLYLETASILESVLDRIHVAPVKATTDVIHRSGLVPVTDGTAESHQVPPAP